LDSSKNILSNEVKIGLTVLAALIIAFIGFRIMRDEPLFRQPTVLYTKFDRVDALLPGNVVQIKGYKIGAVKSMEYLIDKDSTLVTLSITADIPITKGSKAILKKPGPLGAVTIEIEKSKSSEVIEWGSYIQGEIDGGIFETFSEKGEVLTDELTESVTGLNQFMQKLDSSMYREGEDPIGDILMNMKKSSEDVQLVIEKRRADIDAMIANMSSLTENFDDLSESKKEEIGEMISNLRSTSEELETLSKSLNQTTSTVNELLVKINSGEGTLGKMVNDESLYNNLDSLSFNLNELVKSIQKDPKKYLKHMRLVEVF
jgi:ABC-type transporter Mla subunit MlaD